ncbi:hypothetical protein E2C01_079768 [Portunus trituberculatus]|nr:hypothetical protein [Portunus trituberculatus]
MPCKLKA